ncbi:MAG: hypothetical protein JO041_13875 [Acidobacteria bacterium]|nr:hypothetical protein [Acidobacteriota bacterium]
MEKNFGRVVINGMMAAETERHIAEQKAALELHPTWAEGHLHLGLLYRVHANRVSEAKSELLRALELNPALADAHVALGEIYVAEGDMARAREHAEYAAQFGNPRLLEQLQRYL